MAKFMKIYNQFFKEHTLKKYSAANILYVRLLTETDFRFNDTLNKLVKSLNNEERNISIKNEVEKIEAADTADEIIYLMRKLSDAVNCGILCNKILSNEHKFIPAITEKYYRNRQNKFIETAAIVLYQSDPKYLQKLFENYNSITAPYAQAIICLLAAMKNFDNIDEFLLNEYEKLNKYYPKESFADFPLLALYITNNML